LRFVVAEKDAGLLGFFANQITDAEERNRAWERYRIIREFVESKKCKASADLHALWGDSEVEGLLRLAMFAEAWRSGW